MAGTIEARLKALDLALPEAKAAIGTYVPFVHMNGQLLISGQLPMKDGALAVTGQLGRNVELDAGQAAAKLCALNILAQAKQALGDLDRITQLMRLNGFVNAALSNAAAATIDAARGPFISHAPRPIRRSPSTTGFQGSVLQPVPGTVSL